MAAVCQFGEIQENPDLNGPPHRLRCMSMHTSPAPTHHIARVATVVSLLTLVFAFAAWTMVSVGHFSASATVAGLAVSAFSASWIVTGTHHPDHHRRFISVRTRVR